MKLWLDEHIWPGVALLVRQKMPAARIESIHGHAGGQLINSDDKLILDEAHRTRTVLVTFDVNTIPAALHDKAMVPEDHSGVMFVSSKSFAQNDHHGLASALVRILQTESGASWTNRVIFLTRAGLGRK